MNDDEIRGLIAALPEADAFVPMPRGHVAKGRPDPAALDDPADLERLDAWVVANGGQLRSARGPGRGGMRPGKRSAPLPSAPQRYYVIAASALSA